MKDCVICVDSFEENVEIRQIPTCKHVFHANCLENWFKSKMRDEDYQCPLDKSELSLERIQEALKSQKMQEADKWILGKNQLTEKSKKVSINSDQPAFENAAGSPLIPMALVGNEQSSSSSSEEEDDDEWHVDTEHGKDNIDSSSSSDGNQGSVDLDDLLLNGKQDPEAPKVPTATIINKRSSLEGLSQAAEENKVSPAITTK